MRRSLCTSLLLLFLLASRTFAQSFALETTPLTVRATQDIATFSVRIVPLDGFSASVFLRATAPTLPLAEIVINPATCNPPYTSPASIQVRLVGSFVGGMHRLIIEGRNADLFVYDTVTIETEDSGLRIYDSTNSPLPSNHVTQIEFAPDGAAWIATPNGCARFDGERWDVIRFESPWQIPKLPCLAIDSSGAVFVSEPRGIVRLRDWTFYLFPSWRLFSEQNERQINDMVTGSGGDLWCAGSNGLIRINDTNVTIYTYYNSDIMQESLTQLAVDTTGGVWGIGPAGISRFDGRFWTYWSHDEVTERMGPPNYVPLRMLKFPRGRAPLAVAHHGILATTLELTDFEVIVENMYYMSELEITPSGRVWSNAHNSADEIIGLSTAHLSVQEPIRVFNMKNSDLPSDDITAIRASGDTALWIGTRDAGLTIIDVRTLGIPMPAAIAIDDALKGAELAQNTAVGSACLRFGADVVGDVDVELVDCLGRSVQRLSRDGSARFITIDLDGVAAGGYLVRVTNGSRSTTIRLVVGM